MRNCTNYSGTSKIFKLAEKNCPDIKWHELNFGQAEPQELKTTKKFILLTFLGYPVKPGFGSVHDPWSFDKLQTVSRGLSSPLLLFVSPTNSS